VRAAPAAARLQAHGPFPLFSAFAATFDG
jgi:hypothetical protein